MGARQGAEDEGRTNEAPSEQTVAEQALQEKIQEGWLKMMSQTENGDDFNPKTVEYIISSLEANKPMSASELVDYIETMVGYKIRNYELGIAFVYLGATLGVIVKTEESKYKLTEDYWSETGKGDYLQADLDKLNEGNAQPSPDDIPFPDDDGEGGIIKWT